MNTYVVAQRRRCFPVNVTGYGFDSHSGKMKFFIAIFFALPIERGVDVSHSTRFKVSLSVTSVPGSGKHSVLILRSQILCGSL